MEMFKFQTHKDALDFFTQASLAYDSPLIRPPTRNEERQEWEVQIGEPTSEPQGTNEDIPNNHCLVWHTEGKWLSCPPKYPGRALSIKGIPGHRELTLHADAIFTLDAEAGMARTLMSRFNITDLSIWFVTAESPRKHHTSPTFAVMAWWVQGPDDIMNITDTLSRDYEWAQEDAEGAILKWYGPFKPPSPKVERDLRMQIKKGGVSTSKEPYHANRPKWV